MGAALDRDFICIEAEYLRTGQGVGSAGLADGPHKWKAVAAIPYASVRHTDIGRERIGQRQLLVLVVETELELAALYQLDLAQHGHKVNVVHSAEHALEVLTPAYDVVVTDLRLPNMSGEQLIRTVRARPGCADLPVLVIAADSSLPAGIDDRATRLRRKPFALEHFVSYVAEAAGIGRFRN